MTDIAARQRRARKTRRKIAELGALRLTVNKTLKHIYAQVFTANGSKVLACASSLDKEIRGKDFGKGKISVAKAVGELLAKRATANGVNKLAVDRSGHKYHGRVKSLVEAVRENGVEC